MINMINPQFITFTGLDEYTSLDDVIELSQQYPVEFGILVSGERQRDPEQIRYPEFDFINSIAYGKKLRDVKLAAHLCGWAAEDIINSKQSIGFLHNFQRLQINVATVTESGMLRAAATGLDLDVDIIFQARSQFPKAGTLPNMLAQWLFDTSGGQGVRPKDWPLYQGLKLHGYAGGISPENVIETLRQIGSIGTYWIDMETGVRTNDRFDVAKCRAVCEAVYGCDYAKT